MDGLNSFPNPQFMSFQDFSPGNRSGGDGQAELDLGTPSHQSYDPRTIGMMEDLQGFPNRNDQPEEQNTSKSFWSVEYYQKYFNVNTEDVIERLKRSILPNSPGNDLMSHIKPNPDLYGPFWVCVTLVFAIAISGNIANYFQSVNSGNYQWRYEFHIVSQAATCIFLYAWLLPLILWGTLNCYKEPQPSELIETNTIKVLEILCLYGYSLAIYIPVAFLWTIQITLWQWALVASATCLSGSVLVKSLMPYIPGVQKPIYLAVILGLHFIMGVGFMEYFFHIPASPHNVNIVTTTAVPVSIVTSTVKAVLNNSVNGR